MFLLQSPYVIIAQLPGTQIVRFKRLPDTTRDVPEIRRRLDRMVDALDTVRRGDFSLLMDLRDAPARLETPEFEQILDEYRPRLIKGFRKVAVLVKSQVGKLQVARMARQDKVGVRIFDDEDEALGYLMDRPAPR
jgi:hypothetical protein